MGDMTRARFRGVRPLATLLLQTHTRINTMTNETIFYTVEFNINSGKLEEFQSLAKECIEAVRSNEPDMKSYEWFFNAEKTACFVNEYHTSSESMLAHLENVGPLLGKILEVSKLARLDVFGNPNEKATEALKGLNANINGHFDGFTR
jgi:quinol monooxygenase YgiN